jgi:hypothetical protein
MMRRILLSFMVASSSFLMAQHSTDTLEINRFNYGVDLDFMGIGYHGYAYPMENTAITCSGKMVINSLCSPHCKPVFSLGIGTTTIHPIGFCSLSTGLLIGMDRSFFRIGGGVAVAFTEHEVYWHIDGYNGGSGGMQLISYGVQCFPLIGYTYLPRFSGITFSLYLSPHFALPTYELPGPVERKVWPSAGITVGYIMS